MNLFRAIPIFFPAKCSIIFLLLTFTKQLIKKKKEEEKKAAKKKDNKNNPDRREVIHPPLSCTNTNTSWSSPRLTSAPQQTSPPLLKSHTHLTITDWPWTWLGFFRISHSFFFCSLVLLNSFLRADINREWTHTHASEGWICHKLWVIQSLCGISPPQLACSPHTCACRHQRDLGSMFEGIKLKVYAEGKELCNRLRIWKIVKILQI